MKSWIGLLCGLSLFAACSNEQPSAGVSARSEATTVAPTLMTGNYQVGQDVVISFTDMSGSSTDWIGVTAAGSPDNTAGPYHYVGGQIMGTVTFTGLAAGTYVARAFFNDSFVKQAESAPFTIEGSGASTTVTTSALTYSEGQSVVVDYAGMGGGASDWIGIAAAGSPPESYLTYQYTGGGQSGQLTFTGLAQGSFVARAYFNNGFVRQAESPVFTIGAPGPTVTPSASSYVGGQTVTINFDRLPASPRDWISIATPGSADTSFIVYKYTSSTPAGSVTFDNLAPGTYVARAYADDNFIKLAESAQFTVTVAPTPVTLTPDRTAYAGGAPIQISYANFSGNVYDWISIALAGSPDTSYAAYLYTNNGPSGAVTFNVTLPAGSYVARAYQNNDFLKVGQSAEFTVGPPAGTLTAAASYVQGGPIGLTFSSFQGTTTDWIAIAPVGASDTGYLFWMYTGGGTSGTVTFNVSLTPGQYVARGYFNDTFVRSAESAPFDITAPAPPAATLTTDLASYTVDQPITVTFSGMQGTATDWIGIAPDGSADSGYLTYLYTGGQPSGSVEFNFTFAPGNYRARAYFNNSFKREGESAVFAVTP